MKRAFFLLAESVLVAAPSEPSQVQSVPRWKMLVQAAVALLVLLSQQAFPLLMFPTHAQADLSAIDEQPAAFHESSELDTETGAPVFPHPVHFPAF